MSAEVENRLFQELSRIARDTNENLKVNQQILLVLTKMLELQTMQPTPIKQQLND